jgi:hypothetical protein
MLINGSRLHKPGQCYKQQKPTQLSIPDKDRPCEVAKLEAILTETRAISSNTPLAAINTCQGTNTHTGRSHESLLAEFYKIRPVPLMGNEAARRLLMKKL